MIRIPELWSQRKAKRARVNAQLAAADARIPSQLDRWDRPTQEWTAEQYSELVGRLAEPGTWEAS